MLGTVGDHLAVRKPAGRQWRSCVKTDLGLYAAVLGGWVDVEQRAVVPLEQGRQALPGDRPAGPGHHHLPLRHITGYCSG